MWIKPLRILKKKMQREGAYLRMLVEGGPFRHRCGKVM
jgi:hypothetical protein